tara:strand:- start:1475 stop:1732 length:258 start_codon:yes stop_codon:yes gene_type:complete
MFKPNRIFDHWVDGELQDSTPINLDWSTVRCWRNSVLKSTDWWAAKDLTLTANRREYRQFLRDLPQNYDSANDAADAWDAYEVPE